MNNNGLFNEKPVEPEEKNNPLAYRMRPRKFEDFAGQEHLLGKDNLLYKLINSDKLTSCIFYGPPGSGKTALAFLISSVTKNIFISINAITSSVPDIRKIIDNSKWKKKQTGQKTILFIDEISHFNKLQQDALMPEVENGTIVLIGATTQNPFFFINKSLISRSAVFEFKPLSEENIEKIIKRALKDNENGLGGFKIKITDEEIKHLVQTSQGDGRKALSTLELTFLISTPDKNGTLTIDKKNVEEVTQGGYIKYDRGDEHYGTISAFIKSMRGSDPDSAIYWLAKMLSAGEDPRFIARRIVIFASEDIGNADPMALVVAISTFHAVEFIGMPEVQINLAHATIYLSTAPKSNAIYMAIKNAMDIIEKEPVQKVPEHLHTGSNDYVYPHDFKESAVEQKYMEIQKKFYFPKDTGYEKKIKEFLEHMKTLKKQK
ncbi:MAG: replication-associated recombination protein A [Candidatus Omnitrophica bacterium]|nr:replication-associated recombination protein A [Candidatus Omnitrophota bacterium]